MPKSTSTGILEGYTDFYVKAMPTDICCQCNVLIDDKGIAHVADYGLTNATELIRGAYRNIFPWTAPELMNPRKYGLEFRYTEASDVYSFACFTIEVRGVIVSTGLAYICPRFIPARPLSMRLTMISNWCVEF